MNVIIDDTLLWWRAVVVRTFPHTDYIRKWSKCMVPVIGCCTHHAISEDIFSSLRRIWFSSFLMSFLVVDALFLPCECWMDIWSHGLYVLLRSMSGSGDDMFRTWCNHWGEGVVFICWRRWSMLSMKFIIDDALLWWGAAVKRKMSSRALYVLVWFVSEFGDEVSQTWCNLSVSVLFMMLTVIIDAFDECCNWWRLVMITSGYHGYLPSRGLYVSVVLMSDSGDGILETWCNINGCNSLCWPFWSMLLMNVIIADVMWWWRTYAARTFHCTSCMKLWCWFLDSVMGCWQSDGPQFIMHDL